MEVGQYSLQKGSINRLGYPLYAGVRNSNVLKTVLGIHNQTQDPHRRSCQSNQGPVPSNVHFPRLLVTIDDCFCSDCFCAHGTRSQRKIQESQEGVRRRCPSTHCEGPRRSTTPDVGRRRRTQTSSTRTPLRATMRLRATVLLELSHSHPVTQHHPASSGFCSTPLKMYVPSMAPALKRALKRPLPSVGVGDRTSPGRWTSTTYTLPKHSMGLGCFWGSIDRQSYGSPMECLGYSIHPSIHQAGCPRQLCQAFRSHSGTRLAFSSQLGPSDPGCTGIEDETSSSTCQGSQSGDIHTHHKKAFGPSKASGF